MEPSMTIKLTTASPCGWAIAKNPAAISADNRKSLSARGAPRFDDFFDIFPNKLFVSRVAQ